MIGITVLRAQGCRTEFTRVTHPLSHTTPHERSWEPFIIARIGDVREQNVLSLLAWFFDSTCGHYAVAGVRARRKYVTRWL